MALNRKLLNEVLDLIDTKPQLWQQGLWVDFDARLKIAQKDFDPDHPELCGTTACVAGWAMMKSKEYKPVFDGRHIKSFINAQTGIDIEEEAEEGYYEAGRRLLGLTEDQAHQIFEYLPYSSDKPHTFTDQVRRYLHMRTKWGTKFGQSGYAIENARDERELVDA